MAGPKAGRLHGWLEKDSWPPLVIPTKPAGRAERVPKRDASRLGSQISGREWALRQTRSQMSRLRCASLPRNGRVGCHAQTRLSVSSGAGQQARRTRSSCAGAWHPEHRVGFLPHTSRAAAQRLDMTNGAGFFPSAGVRRKGVRSPPPLLCRVPTSQEQERGLRSSQRPPFRHKVLRHSHPAPIPEGPPRAPPPSPWRRSRPRWCR